VSATEQSIKRRRRRRREASFVEAYIPSLQTKLLKFFSFWKDSKLTSFFSFTHSCRFLIQFSSFFFPRVHPTTIEGLCERERMKVFLSCRQATRQAANGRGIDLFCTFFKSIVRIINKCYSV
jgi:hypothetical protein